MQEDVGSQGCRNRRKGGGEGKRREGRKEREREGGSEEWRDELKGKREGEGVRKATHVD